MLTTWVKIAKIRLPNRLYTPFEQYEQAGTPSGHAQHTPEKDAAVALISIAELQTLIRGKLAADKQPLPAESLPSDQAVGRVLAEDIVSPLNLPASNVSAMDGYALPTAAAAGSRWRVVGESAAGAAFQGELPSDGCIRIMTGAVVPAACQCVVMQENTEREGDILTLTQDAAAAANIRFAGEEIQAGSRVLTRGRILREADIMLLAALGFARVAVTRKLKVAVLSTGDELVEPGTPLSSPAQIYDSNRHALIARLNRLPVDIIDLGRAADTLADTEQRLAEAAEAADVIISSGGVSVGDYDFLRTAVERIGTIHHYKVAMKPGKPFVFGGLGKSWYFGLPGNPVSGFVGFDMFVKQALWQLAGAAELPTPLRLTATLSAPVKKSPGRADIQRAVIARQANGAWTAAPAGAQDSHRILGTSQANAYIILSESSGSLAAGEQVEVQPFDGAFL